MAERSDAASTDYRARHKSEAIGQKTSSVAAHRSRGFFAHDFGDAVAGIFDAAGPTERNSSDLLFPLAPPMRSAKGSYQKDRTGLVVIDPYNDFISEGGKLWDRVKRVAQANDCVAHMSQVMNAARNSGLRVFYALHRRYRPGDYESWTTIAPIQKAAWSSKVFEYGTWGGEVRREFEPQPGDIVALEHWCSSGFANTDLDLQLKRHGVQQLIVVGLIAHTCVEATVRFAAELGYEVTLVKDATTDYSDEEMHAALDVNLPNYASFLATTEEVVAAISAG
jgi:nicotinamidase-related amidase